nr:uncharacterized protein LOC115269242 [Aedes albopictus]
MATNGYRENTMRMYFGRELINPKDREVFNFFKKNGITSDMLVSMYREGKEFSVFAKFRDEKVLMETLTRLPATIGFEYDNGEKVSIAISVAGKQFRYVRMFGLPPEVEDREIAKELQKFGIIHHMVREKYGADTGYPIWSGVRGVHMEILRDIPASMHIGHMQARIYYDGLQVKCFTCGSTEHMKANCPKRSSTVNDRLKRAGGRDGAVAAGARGDGEVVAAAEGCDDAVGATAGEASGVAVAETVRATSYKDTLLGVKPSDIGLIGLKPNAGASGMVVLTKKSPADQGNSVDTQRESSSARKKQVSESNDMDSEFQVVNRKRGRTPKGEGRKETDSDLSSTEADHNGSDKATTVPVTSVISELQGARTRSKSKQPKTDQGETQNDPK